MIDTQWPRFQVFLQEEEGQPHQDVGSVHAPDGELALFNARDVFVRRPQCASLWVAPVDAILSLTAQEIEAGALPEEANDIVGKSARPRLQTFHIFSKAKASGTLVENGTVDAGSADQALRKSLKIEIDGGSRLPFAWMVIPDAVIVKSTSPEAASLFEPALDKPFRLSTGFHTVSAMREIKSEQKD